MGSAKFFVIFKDDASGFKQVYCLKHKSDVFESFKVFERVSANKFGRRIKTLHSEYSREYCNETMRKYMQSRGIKHETSAPYTVEQNGKAERDNRTVMECARTMMQVRDIELPLWAEAINAVYLLNRVSVTGKDGSKTPYEIWMGKKPNLKHVRAFGEESFEHVPKQFAQKFDAKAKRVLLVGYEGESTNYQLYHPNTRKVTVSRNVVFRESADARETSTEDIEEEEELTILTREKEEIPQVDNIDAAPRVGTVPVKRNARNIPTVEPRVLRDRSQIHVPSRYETNFAEFNISENYEEALCSPDAPRCIEAIEEKLTKTIRGS